MARILDVSTLAALQDEAPNVMKPSYATYVDLVRALSMWSAGNKPTGTDEKGRVYWLASLSELVLLMATKPTSHNGIGKAARNLCLVAKRENDGYHVAWSQAQLDILKSKFEVAL